MSDLRDGLQLFSGEARITLLTYRALRRALLSGLALESFFLAGLVVLDLVQLRSDTGVHRLILAVASSLIFVVVGALGYLFWSGSKVVPAALELGTGQLKLVESSPLRDAKSTLHVSWDRTKIVTIHRKTKTTAVLEVFPMDETQKAIRVFLSADERQRLLDHVAGRHLNVTTEFSGES